MSTRSATLVPYTSLFRSAVVTRYRTRGAVAEVGKALGLPRDLTKMLTGLVWGWSVEGITDEQISTLNLNAEDHRLKLTLELARQLRSEEHTSELQSLMSSSYAVFC